MKRNPGEYRYTLTRQSDSGLGPATERNQVASVVMYLRREGYSADTYHLPGDMYMTIRTLAPDSVVRRAARDIGLSAKQLEFVKNPGRRKLPPLQDAENGLFVWREDNLYAWDERLDGKTYKRASLAQQEAERRNQAGEHGGMIVARPRFMTAYNTRPEKKNPGRGGVRVVFNRLLGGWYVVSGPHQTPLSGRFDSREDALAWLAQRKTTRATKQTPKRNPMRTRGRVLSNQAISIRYVHKANGKRYEHVFKKGVTIEFLPDGSARFYRRDGRPLWQDL